MIWLYAVCLVFGSFAFGLILEWLSTPFLPASQRVFDYDDSGPVLPPERL